VKLEPLMIAVLVVVAGVLILRKLEPAAAAAADTIQAPASGGSRGFSQENVPPFAGQGAPVSDNPFLAFLRNAQADEWAMA
jgi:hypothetical protein